MRTLNRLPYDCVAGSGISAWCVLTETSCVAIASVGSRWTNWLSRTDRSSMCVSHAPARRQLVNMSEVLHALELDLPHNGKIHCPMHPEKTPSCHIYDDHWHCFGCGQGGDAIAFVRGFFGCSYGRAVQWLARVTDVDPEDIPEMVRANVNVGGQEREWVDFTDEFMRKTEHLLNASGADLREARAFVEYRWGLRLDDLLRFGVRLGRFALECPHYRDGRVVGVKTRSFSGAKLSWQGSRFTAQLYRSHGWMSLSREWLIPAVLVEGESDCWVMTKAMHVEAAVPQAFVYALPAGASTWRDEWATDLSIHFNVYTVLDRDEAGDRARQLVLDGMRRKAPHTRVWHSVVPEGFKDVAEAVKGGWDPRTLFR